MRIRLREFSISSFVTGLVHQSRGCRLLAVPSVMLAREISGSG
jgi:hypothetical protein